MFRLRVLLLAVVLLFSTTQIVIANDAFDTSMDSAYTINDQGNTYIEHHIIVTNKTPTLFIKKFGLKINSANLSDISVTDIYNRTIKANIVTTKTDTSIGINFEDQVVGQSKKREFIISYFDPDVAVMTNSALSVYIPKLADDAVFDQYSVTIDTPARFGQPTRTLPTTNNYQTVKDKVLTHFNQLNSDGVIALFGNQQAYDLNLRYHLENTTNSTGLMQITLPPDTPYQKMQYLNIEPMPISIESDEDGNWIGTYRLEPQQKLMVTTLLKTNLSLERNRNTPVTTPIRAHVAQQTYWETKDKFIKTAAQDVTTPFAIDTFVVNTLEYNQNLTDSYRLGAKDALQNPDSGVCQEFTDLFIALARANEIPARRLTGYAYSENQQLRPLSFVEDTLHAWPEYFDTAKKQWFAIDPTWEDTTGGINYFDQFDLNHIVFAINGVSSTSPYPAGAYKSDSITTKDVEVTLADDFPDPEPQFTTTIKPKTQWGIPIPGVYQLTLTNQTGYAWYNVPVNLTTTEQVTISPQNNIIGSILPFQSNSITFSIEQAKFGPYISAPITIYIYEYVKKENVLAGPQFIHYLKYPVVWIMVGISFAIVAIIIGSVLVHRQRR